MKSSTTAFMWPPCQTRGVKRSVLELVGPVTVGLCCVGGDKKTDQRLSQRASAYKSSGAGIMETDDRQVTTVFTVQPSFHHRHSTNRVS